MCVTTAEEDERRLPEGLRPEAYYYIKGSVIIGLREGLEKAANETLDAKTAEHLRKLLEMIPEDPSYAFT